MDELEFKRLIERYQSGDLSDNERELVDQWLQSLKLLGREPEWSDKEELQQARRLLNHIRYGGTGKVNRGSFDALKNRWDVPPEAAGGRRLYLKIAASVVLLMSSTYMLYFLNRAQDESEFISEHIVTSSTASGQKLNVELPDGSLVILNSRSTIKYPEQFFDSVRCVELTGEAFFEVKTDVEKAFIVTSGGISTRVLGTSFNVRYNEGEEHILVALLSGSVNIQTPAESLMLEKGDIAVFDREEETTTLKKWDYLKDFGWKDGILYFDRATMPEIAQKLEDWYGVDVTIISKNYKRGHFTGSFDNENLKNVLESLSFTFDFSYRWEGNNISIQF